MSSRSLGEILMQASQLDPHGGPTYQSLSILLLLL